MLITIGAEGTHAVINGQEVHIPVEKVTPIDTTGAGDAFVAGILSKIYLDGHPATKEDWTRYIAFGNKLGAICATKPGALSAMPRLIDLKKIKNLVRIANLESLKSQVHPKSQYPYKQNASLTLRVGLAFYVIIFKLYHMQ